MSIIPQEHQSPAVGLTTNQPFIDLESQFQTHQAPDSSEFVWRRKWAKEADNLINVDTVRNGRFTPKEVQYILGVTSQFIQQNNLSNEEMTDIIENSSRGKGIWLNIAKNIPTRYVQAIYRLIHRHYEQNNNQGRWTKAEEQELIKHVNNYGRKWKFISKLIHRTPDNLRNKYNQLGEHNSMFRDKSNWSIYETVQFLQLIYESTGVQLLKESFREDLAKQFGQGWGQELFTINKRKMMDNDRNILNAIQKCLLNRTFQINVKWTQLANELKTKTKDDLRFMISKLSSEVI